MLGRSDSKFIWKAHIHIDNQNEELLHSRWFQGTEGTGESLNMPPVCRDESNKRLWGKKTAHQN